MKRIIAFVMVVALLAVLVGCGKEEAATGEKPNAVEETMKPQEVKEEKEVSANQPKYSGGIAKKISLDWENDDGFKLTAKGEVYEPLLMTEGSVYFDALEIKRLDTKKDVYAMPFLLKIENLTDGYDSTKALLHVRAGYWGLENGMGYSGSVDELLEDDDAAGFVLMGDFADGVMLDRECLGIKFNAKYGKKYVFRGCIYFVDSKKMPNNPDGKVFDYSEEIKFCGLGVKSFDAIGGFNWNVVVRDADSVYMDKVDGRLVFVN